MPLSVGRWKRYAESKFPHEREALEYLRENLPDSDPLLLYSNFEFIADDGSVNEVDALVVTRAGLFLVEMKSRGGKITGNRHTWFWEQEGRVLTIDSPLILANSKARKLGDLLGSQKSFKEVRRPFVEALVFCSDPSISIQLPESDRMRVCGRLPLDKAPGIIPALLRRETHGVMPVLGTAIDKPVARAIVQALEQAGIRHSQRERRVGDYVLKDLIEENPLLSCQDFAAEHPSTKTPRRVRLYNIAAAESGERDRIKEAAKREYLILDGLDHPGIVKALDFREHELGPAIIFRREPDEIRLDHYLAQEGGRLTLDQRLDLIRQLAEALKYAHGRRVIHRALTPRSVLVTGAASGKPQLRIVNWQLGRSLGTLSASPSGRPTTLHPQQLAEGSQLVYIAPEALLDPRGRGETMDVFSLGAIAYHIFTGKPPADSLPERDQILRDSQGFVLSSVLDGVAPELEELIHESTRGEVLVRTESMANFLKGLDGYEEKLTRPAEEPSVHPLEAKAGDRLEGGLVVKQRLGGGSSAIALLVDQGGRELVLKIGRRPEHNDRILAEHATLDGLRHPRIVAPEKRPLCIQGLAGFLMERAGVETLAQRLTREGRLSLDLLQRFGEDLLEALQFLEEQGVSHRDIKPDNIGIAEYGKNHELRLKLFDFSLSGAPLDQIRAGTPPYLEPFLQLKERGRRWDTAAERFAAAMVLHEMATGALPYWGDRQSAPHLVNAEATIEAELIDAPVREALLDFFRMALRRDPKERYDNAADMRAAWHSAFVAAAAPESRQPDPHAMENATAAVQLSTNLSDLPISTRAHNALDRLDIFTVENLLRQPSSTFFQLRGLGNKTRREVLDLLKLLRTRFPESAVPERALAPPPEEIPSEVATSRTIDELVRDLLPAARYKPDHAHRERVLMLLELDDASTGEPSFPTQTEIGRRTGKTRALIGQDLTRARERWRRARSLTEVRNDIAAFLGAEGGLATARELTEYLLAARGAEAADARLRTRRAAAVVRAALETERIMDQPRWEESRTHGLYLLAADEPLFSFAWRLAEAAREVASADPMFSPGRALEMLRATPGAPEALSENRLRRLAAAVGGVSLSPRQELYPTGMPASRALKLAQAALAGLDRLSVEDLRRRVRDRYPEAQPLPGQPDLDSLVKECGLALTWDERAQLYVAPRPGASSSSLSLHTRYTPRPLRPAEEISREAQTAREFERALGAAYKIPSYLVLFTAAKNVRRAEQILHQRFPMNVFNLDSEIIAAMREAAGRLGADWNVVLRADAAPPESQDWRRLQQLLRQALPVVEEKLRVRTGPLLVTYPGLLARYGEMSLLGRLSDARLLHSVWVLVAGDEQTGRPTIDGVPVPAAGANQAAEVPPAWLTEHSASEVAGGLR
jgi:serine/threonine protein kinase